jgi:putative tryptophan/tyrosine transport system substrate-binding protein
MTLSRRRFVQGAGAAGLGLLAACGRLPGRIDVPTKMSRVGFLSPESPAAAAANYTGFIQALSEFGYIDGANVQLEPRWAEGSLDRVPELAKELVSLGTDVLVVTGDNPIRVARQMTAEIPIVMTISADPVGLGHIASLSRPGGNVTGLSLLSTGLAGKQVQLLKETIPGASQAFYLRDPSNPANMFLLSEMESAAQSLGIEIRALDLRTADDLETTVAYAQERGHMLVVSGSALTSTHRMRIAELAAAARIPAMYENETATRAGGLMSYGANRPALFRRAAYYVNRILQGTKPADLPVEQPTTFDFVINLRTAQDLGLTIPQHVLLQATEIIQ